MVKVTNREETINNNDSTQEVQNYSKAPKKDITSKRQTTSLNNLDFDDEDFASAAREYIDFAEKVKSHIPANALDPNYHYVWKTEENARILLNVPGTFYEKVNTSEFDTMIDAGFHNTKGERAMQVLLRCPIGYYKAILKAQHAKESQKLQSKTIRDTGRKAFHRHGLSENGMHINETFSSEQVSREDFFRFAPTNELQNSFDKDKLSIE